jgi:hypothetical protein
LLILSLLANLVPGELVVPPPEWDPSMDIGDGPPREVAETEFGALLDSLLAEALDDRLGADVAEMERKLTEGDGSPGPYVGLLNASPAQLAQVASSRPAATAARAPQKPKRRR